MRTDSRGATIPVMWWLHARGWQFSVGLTCDAHVRDAVLAVPDAAWSPAIDPDGHVRDGAWVAEVTGWLDLGAYPPGTRAICRRERRHPGAPLRFTDAQGRRYQVLVTNQPGRDVARLELVHRQHARVEDRLRAAKATGLANLPFDTWERNAVWLELVLAAQDLTCWAQGLLLDGELAVAEPSGCVPGCGTAPGACSPAPAGGCCCCPPPGRGPPRWPPRSPGCGRCAWRWADPPCRPERARSGVPGRSH